MFRQFQAVQFLPSVLRPTILRAGSLFRLTAFRRCKSKFSFLELVAGGERLNDHSRTNQWQWNKGQANFRSRQMFCSDHAELPADDRARVHYERDSDLHVS